MPKWAPDDRAQLHHDANKALDEHLAPDEAVQVIIRGTKNTAMIGTDRRVFVFKKGIIFGRGLATFDYEDISGVVVQAGLMLGYVALQGPGLQTTKVGWGNNEEHPEKVSHAVAINEKDQARDGATLLRKVIDEFHASRSRAVSGPGSGAADIPDQIRKLGELRDAGILTEQEFQTKKADLLSRM